MKTRDMTFIAMMVALAVVIEIICSEFLDFFWPLGGHPTLSAIPLIILGYKKGLIPALIGGIIVGLIQLSPYAVNPMQYILDYPLAFAFMGLGVFLIIIYKPKNEISERVMLSVGIMLAMFGRFFCHFLSGLLFFSDSINWASIWYSITYNASFIIATTIITIYFVNMTWGFIKKISI